MMTSVQENSGKENIYSEEKWETCTFNVIRTQLKIAKALRNREFRCSFFQTGKTRELLPPASVVVWYVFSRAVCMSMGGPCTGPRPTPTPDMFKLVQLPTVPVTLQLHKQITNLFEVSEIHNVLT